MVKETRYPINEIFYSIQGEGVHAGIPHIFVRFSGCNMACNRKTHGFDCDTDFESKTMMTASEIVEAMGRLSIRCERALLTGGEPMLHVTERFLQMLKSWGYYVAMETNGTVSPARVGGTRVLEKYVDWITVSPKVPDDQVKIRTADEVKFVVDGTELPVTTIMSDHYLLSPRFLPSGEIDEDARDRAIDWILNHPKRWRLSTQQHKVWGVR
jgi:organic radical activating enzyme